MNGARALDIARSSHGDARARTPWARNRSMTCSRARPRRSPSFADARTPARRPEATARAITRPWRSRTRARRGRRSRTRSVTCFSRRRRR